MLVGSLKHGGIRLGRLVEARKCRAFHQEKKVKLVRHYVVYYLFPIFLELLLELELLFLGNTM